MPGLLDFLDVEEEVRKRARERLAAGRDDRERSQRHGEIKPPTSPIGARVGEALSTMGRANRGSLNEFLLPGEGMSSFVNKASYGERPDAWDRVGAGFDLLDMSPLGAMPAVMKGGKKVLEAFHGSPHRFKKFDMSKIGTGEGAQAYGHGLYLADSKNVAKGYREGLSDSDIYYRGKRIADLGLPTKSDELYVLNKAKAHAKGREGTLFEGDAAAIRKDTIEELRDDVGFWKSYAEKNPEYANEIGAEIRQREGFLRAADDLDYSAIEIRPNGALYKVHADIDPDMLLDWDKPLSEQGDFLETFIEDYLHEDLPGHEGAWFSFADALVDEGVIKSSDDAADFLRDMTGGQFVRSLEEYFYLDGAKASALLSRHGFPGIRYLDGDSRKAGEGSYNYVMFDDKSLSIENPEDHFWWEEP